MGESGSSVRVFELYSEIGSMYSVSYGGTSAHSNLRYAYFAKEIFMAYQPPLRVALDFDGVLAHDRGGSFLDFLIKVKQWRVDLDLFDKNGSWTNATGRPKVELDDAYEEFNASAFAPPLECISYAGEVLQKLSSFCEFHLTTSRKGTALEGAINVLGSIGVPFASYNGECFGGKLEVMRKKELHILIDDNPFELAKMAQELNSDESLYAIQFPSFFTPSTPVLHSNVYRLPVCDHARRLMHSKTRVAYATEQEILRQAWDEALHWVGRLAARRFEPQVV